MVRPYERVLRGQRGAAAKTRYLNYLEGLDIEPDIGSRGPKPEQIKLYLFPFSINLGGEIVLEASALEPSYQALKSGMGVTRVLENVPAGRAAIKLRTMRPARVSATSGITATGSVKTSKLTGLKYADYGGTSYTCPFGRSRTSERESEAFAAIKAALTPQFKRIYLIEERS